MPSAVTTYGKFKGELVGVEVTKDHAGKIISSSAMPKEQLEQLIEQLTNQVNRFQGMLDAINAGDPV